MRKARKWEEKLGRLSTGETLLCFGTKENFNLSYTDYTTGKQYIFPSRRKLRNFLRARAWAAQHAEERRVGKVAQANPAQVHLMKEGK